MARTLENRSIVRTTRPRVICLAPDRALPAAWPAARSPWGSARSVPVDPNWQIHAAVCRRALFVPRDLAGWMVGAREDPNRSGEASPAAGTDLISVHGRGESACVDCMRQAPPREARSGQLPLR